MRNRKILHCWRNGYCHVRFSKSSLEFFRIHMWLTPLLAYAVSQYFWRPSLTAVRIRVRIWERGLVQQLAEPAIYLCLCGFMWNLGIQYNFEGQYLPLGLFFWVKMSCNIELILSAEYSTPWLLSNYILLKRVCFWVQLSQRWNIVHDYTDQHAV